MKRILSILLFVVFRSIGARSPPVLLKQTSSLVKFEVEENEPLELRCPVVPAPDLTVLWSKNNQDLETIWPKSNLIMRHFTLKFHRTQFTDAGLYKCNVVNGFGSVQAEFQVSVKSNKTISNVIDIHEESSAIVNDVHLFDGEAPKFHSRDDRSQIGTTKIIQSEDTNVELKCLASGKPVPEVRWKKDGRILSVDDYGVTHKQILDIKKLRQSDTGNYTCEVFNVFGSINATFVLIVTERLNFVGVDPQNVTVESGSIAKLHCRVQTNDPTTRIHWFKASTNDRSLLTKLPEQEYSNNILSRSLIIHNVSDAESGQYLCLVRNDKTTNYRTAFINVVDSEMRKSNSINNYNILVSAIIVPLCILIFIIFFIFCVSNRRRYHYQQNRNRHRQHRDDTFKYSAKQRQPFIHQNDVMFSSAKGHPNNDYIFTSIDSIPVTRQYVHQQQPPFDPSISSELASHASSNLYYARVQAPSLPNQM